MNQHYVSRRINFYRKHKSILSKMFHVKHQNNNYSTSFIVNADKIVYNNKYHTKLITERFKKR